MSDIPETSSPQERLFVPQADSESKSVAYLVGGILLLCAALAGFYLAIRLRVDPLTLQLMTTLPTLLGIGCLLAFYFIRRAPAEVAVLGDRLEVRDASGRRSWAFGELSMANVIVTDLTRQRKLKIYDRAGGCVAVIPDSLQDFDDLVNLLQGELEQRQDDQTAAVKLKKARRQAVLLAVCGVFFSALLVTIFLFDRADAHNAQLLLDQGRPAEATLLRRFTAPDGVTRRVEYRVTDASGATADHNVEVDPSIWRAMQGLKTVAVIAVPGHPDVARLSLGEIQDGLGLSPGAKWLIYIGGGVMCLLFLFMAVLNWRGIDLDLDSQTGKLSIKRFGAGR